MLRTDTDPVKHMRLAALHCCRALHGPELISAWRREPYTRQAHHGRAEAVARPGRAPGGGRGKRWPTGATIWRSHDLLTRAGHAVFGAVLALNGVYAPHRTIKWQSHLIGELNVAPKHFAERLGLLGTSSSARALRQAETLLPDTVQLVQARTDADIGAFCEELPQRRRTIDPPSPATP